MDPFAAVVQAAAGRASRDRGRSRDRRRRPGRAEAVVRAYLDDAGIEWEPAARPGEFVVTLPGEKKLKTVVSLLVGERRTCPCRRSSMRNPDENHEAFYRYLLRRNLRLPGLAYAIDKRRRRLRHGRVPAGGVDAAYLDQLLGVVLEAADAPFNELLALGFLTSMRKEWDWRVSRGESTAQPRGVPAPAGPR